MAYMYIKAFSALCVLMTSFLNASANPLCTDPSEGHLRLQLDEDSGTTRGDLGGDYETLESHADDAEICADGIIEGTIGTRYTCPPVFTEAFSASMYPQYLSNVTHCACDSCYAHAHPSDSNESEWSRRGTCEVVRRTVTVLRRGSCDGGVYSYTPENVEVGVACVCVLSKTNPATLL